MSISTIASNIKASVDTELANVQLPEGVEVTADVMMQIADAGVRGTLAGLGQLEAANLTYVFIDGEGKDDLLGATPADISAAYFGEINS